MRFIEQQYRFVCRPPRSREVGGSLVRGSSGSAQGYYTQGERGGEASGRRGSGVERNREAVPCANGRKANATNDAYEVKVREWDKLGAGQIFLQLEEVVEGLFNIEHVRKADERILHADVLERYSEIAGSENELDFRQARTQKKWSQGDVLTLSNLEFVLAAIRTKTSCVSLWPLRDLSFATEIWREHEHQGYENTNEKEKENDKEREKEGNREKEPNKEGMRQRGAGGDVYVAAESLNQASLQTLRPSRFFLPFLSPSRRRESERPRGWLLLSESGEGLKEMNGEAGVRILFDLDIRTASIALKFCITFAMLQREGFANSVSASAANNDEKNCEVFYMALQHQPALFRTLSPFDNTESAKVQRAFNEKLFVQAGVPLPCECPGGKLNDRESSSSVAPSLLLLRGFEPMARHSGLLLTVGSLGHSSGASWKSSNPRLSRSLSGRLRELHTGLCWPAFARRIYVAAICRKSASVRGADEVGEDDDDNDELQVLDTHTHPTHSPFMHLPRTQPTVLHGPHKDLDPFPPDARASTAASQTSGSRRTDKAMNSGKRRAFPEEMLTVLGRELHYTSFGQLMKLISSSVLPVFWFTSAGTDFKVKSSIFFPLNVSHFPAATQNGAETETAIADGESGNEAEIGGSEGKHRLLPLNGACEIANFLLSLRPLSHRTKRLNGHVYGRLRLLERQWFRTNPAHPLALIRCKGTTRGQEASHADYNTSYLPSEFNQQAVREKGSGHEPAGTGTNITFFHLEVRPTRVYVVGPFTERTNRTLREFVQNPYSLIRVKFLDAYGNQLYISQSGTALLGHRLSATLLNGLCLFPPAAVTSERPGMVHQSAAKQPSLAETHFQFLGYSNSQLRTMSVWMVSSSEMNRNMEAKLGRSEANVFRGKAAARRGLNFSTTLPVLRVDPGTILILGDVTTDITSPTYTPVDPTKHTPGVPTSHTPVVSSEPESVGASAHTGSEVVGSFNFTDGVGECTPALLERVALMCALPQIPSAVQFRLGGAKGVLCAFPGTKPDVRLRKSQVKFGGSKSSTLEICEFSRKLSLTLGKQTLILLDSLGVPHQHFLSILSQQLDFLFGARRNRAAAFALLSRLIGQDSVNQTSRKPSSRIAFDQSSHRNNSHEREREKVAEERALDLDPTALMDMGILSEKTPGGVRLYATLLAMGYLPSNSLIAHELYEHILYNFLAGYLQFRIPYPDGCNLMGVFDFTSSLQYCDVDGLPQVFFQLSDARLTDAGDKRDTDLKISTNNNGGRLVAVTRSPSLHPGDIQLCRVVDAQVVPQLAHLYDVLVFPSPPRETQRAQMSSQPHRLHPLHPGAATALVGVRDIPNMLSGGDLDGDLYSVIWCPVVVTALQRRRGSNPPAMFTTPTTALSPSRAPAASPAAAVQSSNAATGAAIHFREFHEQNNLGQIANAWLKRVHDPGVYASGKAFHKDCLALAEAHSFAVDFQKSGIKPVVDEALLINATPHFLLQPLVSCGGIARGNLQLRTRIAGLVFHSHSLLGRLHDFLIMQVNKLQSLHEIHKWDEYERSDVRDIAETMGENLEYKAETANEAGAVAGDSRPPKQSIPEDIVDADSVDSEDAQGVLDGGQRRLTLGTHLDWLTEELVCTGSQWLWLPFRDFWSKRADSQHLTSASSAPLLLSAKSIDERRRHIFSQCTRAPYSSSPHRDKFHGRQSMSAATVHNHPHRDHPIMEADYDLILVSELERYLPLAVKFKAKMEVEIADLLTVCDLPNFLDLFYFMNSVPACQTQGRPQSPWPLEGNRLEKKRLEEKLFRRKATEDQRDRIEGAMAGLTALVEEETCEARRQIGSICFRPTSFASAIYTAFVFDLRSEHQSDSASEADSQCSTHRLRSPFIFDNPDDSRPFSASKCEPFSALEGDGTGRILVDRSLLFVPWAFFGDQLLELKMSRPSTALPLSSHAHNTPTHSYESHIAHLQKARTESWVGSNEETDGSSLIASEMQKLITVTRS